MIDLMEALKGASPQVEGSGEAPAEKRAAAASGPRSAPPRRQLGRRGERALDAWSCAWNSVLSILPW